MTDEDLNDLVRRAQSGDLHAVEQVLRRCQPRIQAVSDRMLGHHADAQDATQEIMIKIMTSLGTFRAQSDFMTWAHRIAVNHVLTLIRSRPPRAASFDALNTNLQRGMAFGAKQSESAADEELLAYEVFVECAQRMLECLDASHRLALVLVDICDLSNAQAAAVLDVSEEALRQRVSRARRELTDFTGASCGLANPSASCRCTKQVPASLATGSIKRSTASATGRRSIGSVEAELRNLHDLARTTRMLRALPEPQASATLIDEVRRLLTSSQYSSLQ
jgi:RNA polymerase sigma factor (sigma-70 family)